MNIKIFALVLVALSAASPAYAAKGIEILKTNGEALQTTNDRMGSLSFSGDNAVLTSAEGVVVEIPKTEIAKISNISKVAADYSVTFSAAGASVVNPYFFEGVTTDIDGAYVTTTNTNEATEFTFTLAGATADGSFTYNGVYKFTLQLSGVDITSNRGAAIDIQCGKRAAVKVTGTNSFCDYASGKQKACVYFKGHPEFNGDGTINITGNAKHGISSKEYIQLKKNFGALNILAAASDGIHAGQYFQINGGNVVIRNVAADGIQAEITDDPADECNGQIIMKGGKVDIEVSGDDADAMKSDSLFTVSGGTIIINGSGATSKGLKSKDAMVLSDCDITITMTGNGIVNPTTTYAPGGWGPGGGGGWGHDKEDVETSSPGCIKADGPLSILSGTLNLKATGKGGKCINGESTAVIGAIGTEGPTIVAATTGTPVTGSGENINGLPKAVKVYGNLDINSGNITCTTEGNGGEGIECKSQLTINGGVIICLTYDDGINSAAKITVNDGIVYCYARNNDGMDCNGSDGFEFNGGIVLASGANSPEEGFDCDNYKFVINGGTLIGTGGATSNPTSATQPFATARSQSITQGQYLSLQKADGTVICSYKVPRTLSATVLVSSPEFVKGTTYKLVRNSTAVSNPTAVYLDGIFTTGGTLTGGTSSNITPQTK